MSRRVLAQAPGRSELAGNHTDHEGGHVIACGIDRYVRVELTENGLDAVRVASEGYEPFEVGLSSLEPRAEERGTTAALVRGCCAQAARIGGEARGFDLSVESDVLAGSGLSSSAAFEVAVLAGVQLLWGAKEARGLELARLAQEVERRWFGKPCGLMDQAACALGGVQQMDFSDEANPEASSIDADFDELGYSLALVAVGESHAELIDEYAAVPAEMQAVAALLGADKLVMVTESDVIAKAPQIRSELGDRALLRALHFFTEERLVAGRAQALAAHDMGSFIAKTRLSGASSAMFLQNVSAGVREQGAMVAIALADGLLGEHGACRIHGGGFGGTIQAFVPHDLKEAFKERIEPVFGAGSCGFYSIDHEGARAEWM